MDKQNKHVGLSTEHEPVPLCYKSFDRTEILYDQRRQQVLVQQESKMTKSTKRDKFVVRLDQPETLSKTCEEWSMCEYHNLPAWMQDNNYLIYCHRPPLPSLSACFRSIFCMHTETINIWTHCIGCIVFITLAIVLNLTQPNLEERLVLIPFFIGIILCLGFSALFHTLNCHSEYVAKLTNQLDYCGIALLIMGSLMPWIYCSFHCHPWLKVFYLSTTSTLGLCTVGISLSDKFGEPSYRFVRVIVFTMFALSGFVPVVHILFMDNWIIKTGLGTPYFFTGVTFYIMGGLLYTSRIPEKLAPGVFDVWFHSHQIFHILVVAAALCDYQGLIGVYQETISTKCP